MVVVLGKLRKPVTPGNDEEATIFLFLALPRGLRKCAEALRPRHMLAHECPVAISQELPVSFAPLIGNLGSDRQGR